MRGPLPTRRTVSPGDREVPGLGSILATGPEASRMTRKPRAWSRRTASRGGKPETSGTTAPVSGELRVRGVRTGGEMGRLDEAK